MYDVKSMVNEAYKSYLNDSKYANLDERKIEFLSRLKVYEYLRYKVAHKSKVMPFSVYKDYMRLEMSILISDLNYKACRNLKNGYDHLYSEMQPLFNSLDKETKHDLSEACLEFALDIQNSSKILKYVDNEAIATYIRFVLNRYKNVAYNYKLDDNYTNECNRLLNVVGVNKKEFKR